ncbi:MAG: hypothetical protein JO097_04375 [Acidobacteriaceae bacterium]|nr:hypothetical protein [Acidobacteriaceae bacterium]MBV9764957.1 hypothetical protein [Acidobacteriaceae bacterium]
MKFWTSIYFFLCLAASLSAQVSKPKVGVVRYPDQSIRAIYGIPAAFIVGEQVVARADAISFSDSAGLLSRAGKIQLIGQDGSVVAEFDAAGTAPVLDVEGDVNTAIAWLPSRQALLHWDGKAFLVTPLSSPISENVISLRRQSAHAAQLLLATTDRQVLQASVSLDTGDLLSINPLPAVRAPAIYQHSYIVFADPAGLEIQAPDGSFRSLTIPATDLRFERMSSDFLHLTSASTQQSWVLHLSATQLNLSILPALLEAAQ